MGRSDGDHGGHQISQTVSGLRSRCFVNGDPVSVRVLKALAEVFFDINGQYAVTQLGNKQQQMALIDRITGRSALQQEIANTFERMSELKSLVCPSFDVGASSCCYSAAVCVFRV